MKKKNQKKGKYLLGLLVGVIALGVGYAAITNVTLNITGTATTTGIKDDADFTVRYVNGNDTENNISAVATAALNPAKYEVVNGGTDVTASASIQNDLTANFSVENMESGNEVVFTYYIANLSNGVGADITPSISGESSNFEVVVTPVSGAAFHLNENEVKEVTVRVTCVSQSPLEQSENFSITFVAEPTA